MLGKPTISKSILDAVNSVIGEEPVVETKKQSSTMLSEEFPVGKNEPDKLKGLILKKKDDKKAALGKPAIAMTAESKKKMLADDELDETGFHMAAHAAKKSGASQFEFQGKKYPVTAKSHMEEYELDEEGNCVTPMKAKKIADKEVGKHEKKMHNEEKLDEIDANAILGMAKKISPTARIVTTDQKKKEREELDAKKSKEPKSADVSHQAVDFGKNKGYGQGRYMGDSVEMSFKDRLLEKSVSTKQARTMAAAAHNTKFAKKVGIPQDVAKDFNQADKGTKMLSKAMSEEEVLDEKDELRSRIGTNIVNKKPREGQTDLRNIPAGNRPDGKNKFSQGERDSQPSRLKNDIKASLGKHTKPNLPEESEMQESLKDVAKKILHKVGGGSDKDQLKKLQKNMGVPQTGEKPKKKEVDRIDEISREKATSAYVKRMGRDDDKSPVKAVKTIQHIANRYGVKGVARAAKAADKEYGINDPIHNSRKSFVKGVMSGVKEEVVDEAAESPFTSYKDKTKPSIFAPKSHTPKKTSTGTVYTKNWSKKDQKPDDEKTKNEAVDKEADKHVRVDGETDMKTKTVDGLRGRMKVPADYHNKSKSYKVAMTVGEETELSEENDSHTHAAHYEDPKTGEWNGMKLITAKDDEDAIKQAHSNCEDGCRLSKVERHKTIKKEAMEHPDEKEDKALVKKMVKKDALKQTDEAFKGPEAGSGVGDHPFVTAEAKPLKNARELAKKTMHRIKNEMLGKISN